MIPLVDFSVVEVFLATGAAFMFTSTAQVCCSDVAFNAHHGCQHLAAARPQTPERRLHRVPALPRCRLIKQDLVQLHVQTLVGGRGRAALRLRDGRGGGGASVGLADAPVAAAAAV